MSTLIIILSIIDKILLILLGITFLILVIPVEYEFNLDKNDDFVIEGNVLWIFKIIKVKFLRQHKQFKFALYISNKKVFVKNIDQEKKKIENKSEIVNKKDKGKTSPKNSVKDYFEKKFLRDIFTYFKEILEIIKPNYVKIHGEYGFQDPSITGMLCGFIPLISLMIPNRDIMLEPVFDDEILDINLSISGRIILCIVLFKTLKLIFKENIRKKIFKKRKKVETY